MSIMVCILLSTFNDLNVSTCPIPQIEREIKPVETAATIQITGVDEGQYEFHRRLSASDIASHPTLTL